MVDLHTVTVGSGEPVVLLHSSGMSSRQWRKLAERLSPKWRVVMADFFGSGGNPPWPPDQRFHFEEDLDAVDRLVKGPFHLVGHSYGGLIALLLARRRAHELLSFTVYDPVAFGVLYAAHDEEGLHDLARTEVDPLFNDEARGGSEAWLEAFIDYWNGPGAWKALPSQSREEFQRVGRKVYWEVSTLVTERSGADSYSSIACPALLLHGEKSPPAARRVVQLLALALPRATRRCIEGAGHMGPLTHASVVNELIAEHLEHAKEAGGPGI